MSSNWVAFDIESKRLSHEVPGGWDNPFAMGMAVACTRNSHGESKTFVSAVEGDEYEVRKALVEYLLEFDRIISFNGIVFDNVVVAQDMPTQYAHLHEASWDLKRFIDIALGVTDPKGPHVVSLDNIASATLGSQKLLSDGKDAVKLWRLGKFDEVIAYCQQDVDLTAAVYEFGNKHGFVLVQPAKLPIEFGGNPLVAKVKALWQPIG